MKILLFLLGALIFVTPFLGILISAIIEKGWMAVLFSIGMAAISIGMLFLGCFIMDKARKM